MKRLVLLCLLIMACLSPAFAADAPTLSEDVLLPYLEQVISWQRMLSDAEITPGSGRETLLRDTLQHNAKKTLQNAFAFARAEAAILNASKTPAEQKADDNLASDGNSRHAKMIQRLAALDKQMDDANTQIDAVNAAIARAKRSAREALLLQREHLNGTLKLAQAQQDILQTMLGIFSSTGEDVGGLVGKINRLERSMADELGNSSAKPDTGKTDSAKPVASFSPFPMMPALPAPPTDNAAAIEKNDGIFSIGSAMFSLSRKQKDVQNMLESTAELADRTKTLRGALVASMQDAIRQGSDLANASAAPTDAKAVPAQNAADAKTAIETYRQSLDGLLLRYKNLSGALIPLGQLTILLNATTRNLTEWNDLVTQQWKHLFSGLILRLAVLVFSLMIPWLVSELARRATVKYVHDAKRQRQLRILRQILFSTALVIMILLNFVTEFGSLATYAGFLTAGLAVALQTVLLSLTAHFFFFGRFGVRAGDRVTISGVTGDVIQVGMLRIYLMELVGQDTDLRPSGKIVAFPNSVLFNSTAFSKQVAGANYIWSELTILLDAESDFASASKKIMAAVDSVYGEYKEAVELQHTALVESTRLSVKVPAPRSELRFTDKGLACVVFYPLIAKRASEIHGRILTRLIEGFHGDPNQKLIISTPPRIVAVTEGAGS